MGQPCILYWRVVLARFVFLLDGSVPCHCQLCVMPIFFVNKKGSFFLFHFKKPKWFLIANSHPVNPHHWECSTVCAALTDWKPNEHFRQVTGSFPFTLVSYVCSVIQLLLSSCTVERRNRTAPLSHCGVLLGNVLIEKWKMASQMSHYCFSNI